MVGRYGKRRTVKPRVARGGAARATSYRSRNKTSKSSALYKARKSKASPGRNRALAVANAASIKRLRAQQYGPLQQMTSTLHIPSNAPLHVFKNKPLLIHVNNVATGSYGPKVITLADNGSTHEIANVTFTPFYGHHDHLHSGPQFADDHIPNGPKIFLKMVQFRMKFSGRLDNCHIRVDVIRQKRLVTEFWKDTASHQNLPHTLNSLQDLAGFTPNFLPKQDYQVLASKRVFINSRGTRSNKDQALHITEDPAEVYDARAHSVTTPATTENVKLLTINVPINRVTKQLENSVSETNGEDNMFGVLPATNEVGASTGGNYRYNNIHPLANIWLMISSDDTSSEVTSLGDQCKVEVIRYAQWRDAHD